jgi:hypothetical protein
MAREFEPSDNSARNQGRQPQQQSGEGRSQQKLRGKSFQVNENSVENGEPVRSPAPPQPQSSDKHNQQNLEGKAFQVNENSVEDGVAPPVASAATARMIVVAISAIVKVSDLARCPTCVRDTLYRASVATE